MKKSILSLLLLLPCMLLAQTISFESLEQKMKTDPRPIVIALRTDWCNICKMQSKQFDSHKPLQHLLANQYYYLELNAETKEAIIFNGKKYNSITNGNISLHELAYVLGNNKGQLSYPTLVILDSQFQVQARFNGLVKAKTLYKLLNN